LSEMTPEELAELEKKCPDLVEWWRKSKKDA
jgi:hypothetical protein